MASIVGSLERIAFNGDPLQFMLIETTYQPFISLLHMTEVVNERPDLAAIRKYLALVSYWTNRLWLRLFSRLRICALDRIAPWPCP